MRVTALVQSSDLAHLRRAAPPHWVISACDLRDALGRLAANAGGVVVFDPSEFATDAFEEIIATAAAAGGRVVICGDALSVGAGTLIKACETAHVELSLTSVSRNPSEVISLVGMPMRSVPTLTLRAIAPHLLRLPERFAGSIARLFSFAPLPKSLLLLTAQAGKHQTTVGTWLNGAGLCSPRRLWTVARLSRACHYALSGNLDIESVRVTCAFKSMDAFERAFRRLADCTFSTVAAKYTRESIAVRLGVAARLATPSVPAG